MSCGLGAIILVFILVKPGLVTTFDDESKKIKAELSQVIATNKSLSDDINKSTRLIASEQEKLASIRAEVSRLESELSASLKKQKLKRKEISSLKNTIENTPVDDNVNIVSNEPEINEEYLLGLRVEGRRIVFLVDISASMTDEALIDIIKRKSKSDSQKKNGPKWLRTKRIVHWLISKLPESSTYSVIGYNGHAKYLGNARWHSSGDEAAKTKILAKLDDIVPSGPTNLQDGLAKVKSLSPGVTDLYVITDGLPTSGKQGFSALRLFSGCTSITGRSNTISGQCRIKLFRQTLSDISLSSAVRVNTILLPLEGDPEASPNYWAWASATGGTFISPALNWP